MKAILRNARISPKKANLVAGMVRGRSVRDALEILEYAPKKAASILYKVVHSAASNAKNNFNQSFDNLVVTRILVTKGPTLKRWWLANRGRALPLLKRSCHITVEVGAPAISAAPVAKKKTPVAKKTAPKKAAKPKKA